MNGLTIRPALDKDIPALLGLLSQVLELHADIRPDIFIHGTTKYSREELSAIISDDKTPVFVAETSSGEVAGYVFCMLREPPAKDIMVRFHSLYIDDLCVDENYRGQGVGGALFDYVKDFALRRGCYEITLNVWEGNDSAKRFYENLGMKPKSVTMELIL